MSWRLPLAEADIIGAQPPGGARCDWAVRGAGLTSHVGGGSGGS